MHKRFGFILYFIISGCLIRAQTNLVSNPGFELYDTCPNWVGQIQYAVPWADPTIGTSDYYNTCFDTSVGYNVASIPANALGYQAAWQGNAYAGFFGYNYDSINNLTYREYIQALINSPLTSGVRYYVTFYVSLADSSRFAIDDIGAFISIGQITRGDADAFGYIPQIENTQGIFLSDTAIWYKISGSFVASGNENYITIGNFKSNVNTDTIRVIDHYSTNSDFNSAYYYIDEICISTDSLLCNSIAGIYSLSSNNTLFYYSDRTIKIKSPHKSINIQLFSMSGQLILEQKIEPWIDKIELINLDPGIYLLRTDLPYQKSLKILIN